MAWDEVTSNTGTVRAGDGTIVNSSDASNYNFTADDPPADDAQVSVVWQDADSDQSSTLRTWTRN